MIKFKCKDFLMKECEFETKGTHSIDEMMKLVEVHAGDEHRTLRLSPETIEKIRTSLEKQRASRNLSLAFASSIARLIPKRPVFWSDASRTMRSMPPRRPQQLFRR